MQAGDRRIERGEIVRRRRIVLAQRGGERREFGVEAGGERGQGGAEPRPVEIPRRRRPADEDDVDAQAPQPADQPLRRGNSGSE